MRRLWFVRRAYYETIRQQTGLLLFLLVTTLVILVMRFAINFEIPELQQNVMFCMGAFLPLGFALVTANLILKENENRTAVFVASRVNLAHLWLSRYVFALAILSVYLIGLIALLNLITPGLFPQYMGLTLIVPALFFSAIANLTGVLAGSSAAGVMAAILCWAWFYFGVSIAYGLWGAVYYPFLEWGVYFDIKMPISALPENKLFFSLISLVLIAICYGVYQCRFQVERFVRG